MAHLLHQRAPPACSGTVIGGYSSLSYQTTCKVSSGFSFLKVHSSVVVADRSRMHQPLGWLSSSGESSCIVKSPHKTSAFFSSSGFFLKPADPLFRLSICPQKYYRVCGTTGHDFIANNTSVFVHFFHCLHKL